MAHANYRRLAKNTLALYLRLFLSLVISLYTSRLVLAVLGFDDYGIYTVVAGAIVMLSFLNAAMTTGTQRFLAFEMGAGRQEEVAKVFGAALLLHVFIAVVVLVLAETIGLWILKDVLSLPPGRSNAAYWLFQFTVVGYVINIVQVPYMAAIVANERMELYAYLSIADVLLKLISVYILMFMEFDKLILYGALNLSVSFIVTGAYAVVARSLFSECRPSMSGSTQKIREMSSFLGWNAFSHIAVAAGVYGVNILLNVYFGPTVNAARGVAIIAADAIRQFAGTFQLASAPQITKTFSAGELAEQKSLIVFACKSSFLLLLVLAVPIFVEVDAVLTIWLKNPPPDAGLFLRYILCDALVCTSANPMYFAIMATGRIRGYQLIGGGVNFANFGMCWALLEFGAPAYAVFIVLILTSSTMFCLRLAFLRRRIGLLFSEYFVLVGIPGLKVLTLSSLLPGAAFYLMDVGPGRLVVICVSSCVSSIVSIYIFGLTRRERGFLAAKIVGWLRHVGFR